MEGRELVQYFDLFIPKLKDFSLASAHIRRGLYQLCSAQHSSAYKDSRKKAAVCVGH